MVQIHMASSMAYRCAMARASGTSECLKVETGGGELVESGLRVDVVCGMWNVCGMAAVGPG